VSEYSHQPAQEAGLSPREVDPRTAHANWSYEDIGRPFGESCIGRVAYWFLPDEGTAFGDDDMLDAWPELHQQWHELRRAAYLRCQEAGEASGKDPIGLPYRFTCGGLLPPP
jgi:hypothetical protein